MKKIIYTTFFIFVFINFSFSQNEKIKSLIESSYELNLNMSELADFGKKHIKNKDELTKFFYYWIGSNIKYDNELLENFTSGEISAKEFSDNQDALKVFVNRKGVCAGYANLFKWFMSKIDVEAVVISGHIRDERNHYVELNSDDDFRHAWNAIKLNNKWILIDTTWGTSEQGETSEFYYNIKPEYSINTHFPEDSKWQLLKEPLSLETFNKSQYINPIWFMKGFNSTPKLLSDNDYYYFTFKTNKVSNWTVGLKFSTDNIDFNTINDIKVIEQDGLILYRFSKKNIPRIAFFKVKIAQFINNNNGYSKLEYDNVINFKI